jgi:hypothetical protein
MGIENPDRIVWILPPVLSRASITATERLFCERMLAAIKPEAPAPIIITSYAMED